MTSCPHASDQEQSRTCGLVVTLTGLPPDLCVVGLDACGACGQQARPQSRNPVTVSLAVTRLRPHDPARARQILKASSRPRPAAPQDGAGTRLTVLLRRFGIEHEPGCQCDALEREMNRGGPDWCEERVGMIVSRMKEEAKRRNLPFSKLAATMLVKLAIRQARKLTRRGPDGL